MDLWTMLIAVAGVAAFVIPFVLFNQKKKNSDKGIVLALKQYAEKHNFEVNDFEVEKNKVLGVDHQHRIAFFLKQVEGKEDAFQYVELASVSLCRVDRKTQSVKSGESVESFTEKIDLLFVPKSKKMNEVTFNLFDIDEDKQLLNELQFAKKWVDIFNQRTK